MVQPSESRSPSTVSSHHRRVLFTFPDNDERCSPERPPVTSAMSPAGIGTAHTAMPGPMFAAAPWELSWATRRDACVDGAGSRDQRRTPAGSCADGSGWMSIWRSSLHGTTRLVQSGIGDQTADCVRSPRMT